MCLFFAGSYHRSRSFITNIQQTVLIILLTIIEDYEKRVLGCWFPSNSKPNHIAMHFWMEKGKSFLFFYFFSLERQENKAKKSFKILFDASKSFFVLGKIHTRTQGKSIPQPKRTSKWYKSNCEWTNTIFSCYQRFFRTQIGFILWIPNNMAAAGGSVSDTTSQTRFSANCSPSVVGDNVSSPNNGLKFKIKRQGNDDQKTTLTHTENNGSAIPFSTQQVIQDLLVCNWISTI